MGACCRKGRAWSEDKSGEAVTTAPPNDDAGENGGEGEEEGADDGEGEDGGTDGVVDVNEGKSDTVQVSPSARRALAYTWEAAEAAAISGSGNATDGDTAAAADGDNAATTAAEMMIVPVCAFQPPGGGLLPRRALQERFVRQRDVRMRAKQ